MSSIDRQLWQSAAVLGLSISLIGCGSKSAPNTVQSVPATNAGGAPAGHGTVAPGAPNQMAAHAAMPGAAMPAQPGGATVAMTPDQMAKMGGQAHAMQSGAPASANPSSPSSPEQMAKMQHSMPSGGQSSSSAPPGITPEQMAKMQSSDPNSANANPNAANPQAADAMKKQAMNAHGGASSAPNAQANANPNANNPNPGQPAAAGQPGSGGAAAPNLPPGSADEAVYKFCVAMAEGDTATASQYVSSKAKGILAEMAEGTLAEEKIEEITNLLTPFNELVPNTEQTSSTKRSLRNGKGQSLSFTLKKEKDVYRITEFSYPKTKKKS